MQSVSEFVIYGVVEVFVALLLMLGVLTFFNLRLRKRVNTLGNWLQQLKQTTKSLAAEVNEAKKAPTISYADYLRAEVEATEKHHQQMNGDASLSLSGDQSSFSRTTALRHGFLAGELAAAQISDQAESWRLLDEHLGGLSEQLTSANTHNTSADDDAAPKAARAGEGPTIDLGELKDVGEQQKSLIQALLQQKQDAESQVTVKMSELEKLQQYHRESEVCIQLLEEELETAQQALEELKANSQDSDDMKQLIQRFSKESSEMLSCIETLEKEVDDLRAQLGE